MEEDRSQAVGGNPVCSRKLGKNGKMRHYHSGFWGQTSTKSRVDAYTRPLHDGREKIDLSTLLVSGVYLILVSNAKEVLLIRVPGIEFNEERG